MTDQIPVRRALISVYDKTGLEEYAKELADAGVELVSTGSTATRIAAAGIPVAHRNGHQLSGVPRRPSETAAPADSRGILADRRLPERVAAGQIEVEPFDLVVVNLYPFAATVASGASEDDTVEQIDIGGPSMVRAAANHPSVAVVVTPEAYEDVLAAVASGGFTLGQRKALAAAAFRHTATYDIAVASWMGNVVAPDAEDGFPGWVGFSASRSATLRYGENPHKHAAIYTDDHGQPGLAGAQQLQGKEMSYNNYVDADAAWRAAHDFDRPAVAVIKHANPCGVAVGDTIADAHAKAHATDPMRRSGASSPRTAS